MSFVLFLPFNISCSCETLSMQFGHLTNQDKPSLISNKEVPIILGPMNGELVPLGPIPSTSGLTERFSFLLLLACVHQTHLSRAFFQGILLSHLLPIFRGLAVTVFAIPEVAQLLQMIKTDTY